MVQTSTTWLRPPLDGIDSQLVSCRQPGWGHIMISLNMPQCLSPHPSPPKMALSVHFCLFWYWCYYPHTSRDLVSSACGIFSSRDNSNNIKSTDEQMFKLKWPSLHGRVWGDPTSIPMELSKQYFEFLIFELSLYVRPLRPDILAVNYDVTTGGHSTN